MGHLPRRLGPVPVTHLGGIHPPADDLPGRRIGLAVAEHALNRALPFIEANARAWATSTRMAPGVDDFLFILASYNDVPMNGTEDLTYDGVVGDDILASSWCLTTCE